MVIRTGIVIAAASFLCVVPLAVAESPFGETGQHPPLRGEIVTFSLTPQQNREVQRLRVFRPTAEQLALLRAVRPACANLLHVYTPWFNDCGCGLRNIALWDRPGEIDVPIGYLRYWDRMEEDALQHEAAQGDSAAIWELEHPTVTPALTDTTMLYRRTPDPPQDLYMDMNGNVYCNGLVVEGTAILARLTPPTGTESPVIWLYLPPPLDQRHEVQLLNDAFEIAHLVASKGYKLRVGN